MSFLDKILQDNWDDLRYQVLKIELNPKEKEYNQRVYGAIWFDRECAKDDILMEASKNPADAEMILIIDDAPDGAGFRCLFSVFGSTTVPFTPEFQVGSLYRLSGKLIGVADKGMGKVTFGNPFEEGETTEEPVASLGFLSEFGYDDNGNLIKL